MRAVAGESRQNALQLDAMIFVFHDRTFLRRPGVRA
jgi:hypothetical protein